MPTLGERRHPVSSTPRGLRKMAVSDYATQLGLIGRGQTEEGEGIVERAATLCPPGAGLYSGDAHW